VVISIIEKSLMTPEIVAFMKEIAGSGDVFGVDVICRNGVTTSQYNKTYGTFL